MIVGLVYGINNTAAADGSTSNEVKTFSRNITCSADKLREESIVAAYLAEEGSICIAVCIANLNAVYRTVLIDTDCNIEFTGKTLGAGCCSYCAFRNGNINFLGHGSHLRSKGSGIVHIKQDHIYGIINRSRSNGGTGHGIYILTQYEIGAGFANVLSPEAFFLSACAITSGFVEAIIADVYAGNCTIFNS